MPENAIRFFEFLVAPIVLVFAILWIVRRGKWDAGRALGLLEGRRFGAGCVVLAYFVVFSALSVLRYLSLHSTLFDLGIYDNRVWRIAHLGELAYAVNGHFCPILVLLAPLYWMVNSPVVLLVVQTGAIAFGGWILFKLARLMLESEAGAFVVMLCYFLYPALEFNTLYDFHPDCMILPVLLAGFYFIERGNKKWFLLSLVPGLLLKEPLLFSIAGMGCYAAIRRRWFKEGLSVVFVGFFVYFAFMKWMHPSSVWGPMGETYGYLGKGPILGVLTRPWVVIRELVTSPDKIAFTLSLLYPLLFLPLLHPAALLPSLPHFAISILSHTPAHTSVCGHYTASVIPGLFVAALLGVRMLRRFGQAWVDRALVVMLAVSLYYNVIQSPSPISLKFWVVDNWYNKESYVVSSRDRELVRLMRAHIPKNADAGVCTQNTLNHAWLAHRRTVRLFPDLRGVHYVVLDTHRPLCLLDQPATREEFFDKLADIRENFETVVDRDGFLILRRAGIRD